MGPPADGLLAESLAGQSVKAMEGDNEELLALFEATRKACGELATPLLSQVSPRLSSDIFVVTLHAGKDRDGNTQLTEAALEQLTLRFGCTISSVLLGLRSLCSEPWLVSSEGAFEASHRAEMTLREAGYGTGNDLFGVCFGLRAQHVVLRESADGLTKCVVDRHQLDSMVKALQAEGCVCDPSIHWTTLIETSELFGLWANARCGYGCPDDGILLPLSQVSVAMAEDDSCAAFCMERAGADSQGNPLVSEKLLGQLATYFGRDIKTVISSLHDMTGHKWFLRSAMGFRATLREGGLALVLLAQCLGIFWR